MRAEPVPLQAPADALLNVVVRRSRPPPARRAREVALLTFQHEARDAATPSSAGQPRSWRANGPMHAEVLPEPIGPQTRIPVSIVAALENDEPPPGRRLGAGERMIRLADDHGGSVPTTRRRSPSASHTRPTTTATDHAATSARAGGREGGPSPDRLVQPRRVHGDIAAATGPYSE